MRKSRFSEEQIIGILREGQGGGTVKAVCAKHNVSEQTYYGWKRRYGGMAVWRWDGRTGRSHCEGGAAPEAIQWVPRVGERRCNFAS